LLSHKLVDLPITLREAATDHRDHVREILIAAKPALSRIVVNVEIQ
jgi:hypothetical protein